MDWLIATSVTILVLLFLVFVLLSVVLYQIENAQSTIKRTYLEWLRDQKEALGERIGRRPSRTHTPAAIVEAATAPFEQPHPQSQQYTERKKGRVPPLPDSQESTSTTSTEYASKLEAKGRSQRKITTPMQDAPGKIDKTQEETERIEVSSWELESAASKSKLQPISTHKQVHPFYAAAETHKTSNGESGGGDVDDDDIDQSQFSVSETQEPTYANQHSNFRPIGVGMLAGKGMQTSASAAHLTSHLTSHSSAIQKTISSGNNQFVVAQVLRAAGSNGHSNWKANQKPFHTAKPMEQHMQMFAVAQKIQKFSKAAQPINVNGDDDGDEFSVSETQEESERTSNDDTLRSNRNK